MLVRNVTLLPFKKGYLKVDDIHQIYWEQYGNPNGIPVVFLHGGPGGSISCDSTRFFNLKKYHVILFDQRGCGKSKPRFCLENNTTNDLVNDIEKLRNHLEIKKWLVFGGSWGSTLGLIYAINYHQFVSGLILRGIFLARPFDWDWLIEPFGAGQMFPEKYNNFIKIVPLKARSNIKKWYYEQLNSPSEKNRLWAGKHWSEWETSLLFFNKTINFTTNYKEAYQIALMECHYAIHNTFLNDSNYILNQAKVLKSKPCWLIHGQYDFICPPKNAYELKQILTKAKLVYAKNAGHSSSEPTIFKALKQATDEFAMKFKK